MKTRFSIGQAPRLSHPANQPLERRSVIQQYETSATPVLLWLVLLFSTLNFQLSAFAQSFSIDWFKIAGGGGTSTGGVYTVSGTIGQPDAGAMSGGNYTLVGGFWGVVAALQTPGAPSLSTRARPIPTFCWRWPKKPAAAHRTPSATCAKRSSSFPGTRRLISTSRAFCLQAVAKRKPSRISGASPR